MSGKERSLTMMPMTMDLTSRILLFLTIILSEVVSSQKVVHIARGCDKFSFDSECRFLPFVVSDNGKET